MTLRGFAEAHNLQVEADDLLGSAFITLGKALILDGGGDGRLLFCPPTGSSTSWGLLRARLVRGGMELEVDEPMNGELLFSPDDTVQLKLAFEVAGARAVR